MSNETKAPEWDAPVTTQEPVADENKGKGKNKGKSTSAGNTLRSVGQAACKRAGLPEVWVTTDGMAFGLETDAKAHAQNLPSKEIQKVTAK